MIDGPLSIVLLDPESGQLTATLAPGVHYNVTEAVIAEHPELNFFRVTPTPFQRVWAGDDPEAVTWTVALRFVDADQAASYLDVLTAGAE